MNKEIKFILFSLLLSLSACGKVGGNQTSNGPTHISSSNGTSSFNSISTNISNSSFNSSNEIINSSSSNEKQEGNVMINENASKIMKAQENISKTSDNISNAQPMSLRKERRKKSLSHDGLNGEFLQGYFDPGPLIKMSAEPLSFAFATLEGLIATGNASIDINDQTFYFSNNSTPIRVNYFEDHSDYVFIRYADYRMLLNSNEENTFVLSFGTGNNDSIWMNYETLTTSLTYWQSDKAWYEEIDALIDCLDEYNQDSISGEPLRYIKSIFEKENNDLDAWKENGSNILSESEYTYQYMHHHNLREMYYARYDEFLGNTDNIVIEGNKLVKINSLSKNTFLDVPSSVEEISTLTKRNEYQKVYAMHLPTSVTNIEKGALNDLNVELLFVDYTKDEISEELYNIYLNSGDNVRILFKDQWTITHDLYIPNEYYYAVLDNNMFNISLKGLMKDFNKIYEFEEFLTKEDYQKYLDLMYEYCDLIINTLEDLNNILQVKVEYFDSVINSICLDATEYCFYYINELNEEVVVDGVDGSIFLEKDLHIKKVEVIENENNNDNENNEEIEKPNEEEKEENKEDVKDEEVKDEEKEEVKDDEFVDVE